MSTRARVKLQVNGKMVAGKYYPMDGHLWSFVPQLISLLKEISIPDVLNNLRLFKFFGQDGLYGERDEFLDFLCVASLEENGVGITLSGFKGEEIFCGDLRDFEKWAVEQGIVERYESIRDCL